MRHHDGLELAAKYGMGLEKVKGHDRQGTQRRPTDLVASTLSKEP
jgi:hypothetical protein